MWVGVLFLQQGTDWSPVFIDREPSVLLRVYLFLVLPSLVVVFANLCRNWILILPFRRAQTKVAFRAAAVFRRQALSLRRWIGLNILAWALVTLAGLLQLLDGTSVQRVVGVPIMALGLRDALEPSLLFFWTMVIFYVVRWHILWRAERLERHYGERAIPTSVAGIIGKTED